MFSWTELETLDEPSKVFTTELVFEFFLITCVCDVITFFFSAQATIMVSLTSIDCCRHPAKSLAYDVLVPGGPTAAMSKHS